MINRPKPTQQEVLHQLRRSEIKLPPVQSELTEILRLGPSMTPQATKVYVWADALTELIYAALRRPTVMQTAILVGGLYAGPGERFVEIRGYVDLERFDDSFDFSRELNEAWLPLNNRISRRGEGMSMIGWACLRTATEDEPARDLQVAHRSFFNLPHQILLTIDPETQHLALYGFDEIGRLVQIGFHLVRPRSDRASE